MHFMNVKQKLLIATLAGVMVTAGVGATKDTAHAAEADADVVTTVDDAETGGNTDDVSDDSTDDAEGSADDETDDLASAADVDDAEDVDNTDNADSSDDVNSADIAADVSEEKQKAPKDTLEVAATQNGWVTEGNYTYYYVDGVKVSNTVMEIDKKLYGFRSDGRRYEDASFSIGGTGRGWSPSSIMLTGRGTYFQRKLSLH